MTEPMTLGELITALKKQPQDAWVYFELGYMRPTGLASYRGYYDQLAIGFADGEGLNCKELLLRCENAVGEIFTGYKGGDYKMHKDTPVWASNYGEASGTGIVGVVRFEYHGVVLQTAYCED